MPKKVLLLRPMKPKRTWLEQPAALVLSGLFCLVSLIAWLVFFGLSCLIGLFVCLISFGCLALALCCFPVSACEIDETFSNEEPLGEPKRVFTRSEAFECSNEGRAEKEQKQSNKQNKETKND